jgi:regulatory protein
MNIEVKAIKSKKNQFILELLVDNQTIEYDVSDEIILDFRLVKGKVLDKETYQALKENILHDKYRQKLLHYATYKPRTVKEARDYLSQFDMPEKAKAKYIQKLMDGKILDDDTYVKNYIDEYSHFRLIGPRKIEFDLIGKGIDKHKINQMMGLYSTALMKENIGKLIEKKVKSSKNKALNKIKQTVKAYVINKGYDYELVQAVLEDMTEAIENHNDEDMAIQKDYDKYLRKYKKSNQSQSFKSYMIPKLMQKGYGYHKIIELLEGEEVYED